MLEGRIDAVSSNSAAAKFDDRRSVNCGAEAAGGGARIACSLFRARLLWLTPD
jgi:hypothetical protein